jgi:hypothetical protein
MLNIDRIGPEKGGLDHTFWRTSGASQVFIWQTDKAIDEERNSWKVDDGANAAAWLLASWGTDPNTSSLVPCEVMASYSIS